MKNLILALMLSVSLSFPAMAAHVTVDESETRIIYSVGGSSDDTFTIPFTFYDTADIDVYVNGSQLSTADYTVTGTAGTTGGYEGGTVTLDTGVTNSTVIVLLDMPIARTTDFPASSEFNITSLNTQLDKLVSLSQQLDSGIRRSLKLPIESSMVDGSGDPFDMVFAETPEDGQVIYFSSADGGFVNGPDASDIDSITTNTAAAAASASAASASASAASSSASAASSSASAASVSAAAAASSADELTLEYVGAWTTATAYVQHNIVFSSGSSYIATADHTSGASTEPGIGGSWSTVWDLFARQGNAGAGTGDMLSTNNLSDVADAATSRTNLGLGTIATQAANNVTISGGAVTGITDLAIADGGTGASTAANAFTALKQDATESATGVVELATTAEVTTGTDTTRAVTPAGVAAAIAAAPASINGYSLIDMQVFTASGTWTKPANTTAAYFIVVGAGGGGGGAYGTGGGSNSAAGGGGGGGGSCMELATSGLGATETVTIGAAGAAGSSSGGNGGAGGTSSFGSHCSATGGAGGTGTNSAAATTASLVAAGGAEGAGSSGSINLGGGEGSYGFVIDPESMAVGGIGGGSMLGGGGRGAGTISGSTAGSAGSVYGAGGGGAANVNSGSGAAGGAGAAGAVIVFSYGDGP